MIEEPKRHVLCWPEQGVEMAFRLIPSGTFRMGSRGYNATEEPIHEVSIGHDFWMAETPVTQAQFALWTRSANVGHENHFKDRPAHPAESMDWRQAVSYCAWLGKVKVAELPAGYPLVCLPTEAEWEYACRAGTETEYYNGDGEAALAQAGWFDGNSGSQAHAIDELPQPLPEPHRFRLYGMHGNVWEWCADVFDPNAYRKRPDGWEARAWTLADAGTDAETWEEGAVTEANASRVLRGGSWLDSARNCRSAYRIGREPGDRNWNFGFRVCLVRGPAARQASQAAEPVPGDGGRGTRPESDGAGGAPAGAPDLARASFPEKAARKGSGKGKRKKPK